MKALPMRTLGLVAAVALLAAAGPRPKIFRSQKFGIAFPIPRRALACFSSPGQDDDGVFLLLGTADAERCHEFDRSHERQIFVYATSWIDDTTKRLSGLLAWECYEPCAPAPGVWRLAGLQTEAGKVTHPDGSIDIVVVAQGKPGPASHSAVPSVNYTLSLHTGPRHFDEDLRAFREVLRTLRISPVQ